MAGGKFVLRDTNDTENPIAPRLYDIGLTAGRNVVYLPNAVGNRTAFLAVLSEGARFIGDTGCHRAIKVIFAGFDLPEFDSGGGRNWRFHDGRIPAIPVYKKVTAIDGAFNSFVVAGHGYTTGMPVAFFARGENPISIPRHTKVFVGDVTTDSFNVKDAGGAYIDLPAVASPNLYCYKADAGLFDAQQGRPEFFPTMDDAFAGFCYIEILLPAELSNGEDEPTKLKVILDGKLVYDYAKVSGELSPTTPVPSKNPALIALDFVHNDGGIPLTRFEPDSTLAWRDRCSEKINWIGGNENPAAPAAFPHLDGGIAYNVATATLSNPAGTYTKAVTPALTSSRNMSLEGIYNGGDIMFAFSSASNGGTVAHGAICNGGILYFNNNDGAGWQPCGECAASDRIKIAYYYDEFYIYRNGVPVPLSDFSPSQQASSGDFYGVFGINNAGATISDVAVAPSGSNAAPRQVDRFTGGIVILQKAPISEVFETEVALCGGVSWQDVDGRVQFLTTPDRTPVMTFNADAGSVNPQNVKKCRIKRRPAKNAPNYYRLNFRDRDDVILTRKWAYVDRPEHRAANGYIDSGVIQYGVMVQSQAERLGETRARLTTDLDITWTVEAFLDSLEVTKGDFCYLVDDASGFPDAAPALVMVLSELLLHNGDVENRNFEVTIITPDFYSDSSHGRVVPVLHNHAEQKFVPPPPVESLTITETLRSLENQSTSAIEGETTFAAGAGQKGKVFIRSFLSGGITVAPNAGANTFSGSGLGDLAGQVVCVISIDDGGRVPLGVDTDAPYLLVSAGAGAYQLQDVETAAVIDFSDTGAGAIKIFPFVTWKQRDIDLTPDPSTRAATFSIEPVENGFHLVRVVSYSAGGASVAFGLHRTERITVTGDTSAPDEPSNVRASFDGVIVNYSFDASPSTNVKGYQVRDGNDRIVKAFIPSLTFEETIQTSTVTRRIYAVSRSGVRSIDFAALTFNVPPPIYWTHSSGGQVQTDNAFKKTAAAGYGNCGAIVSNLFFSGENTIRFSHIIETTNVAKIFGFSAKRDNAALGDIAFGWRFDTSGNAYPCEAGTDKAAATVIAAGLRLTVEINVAGVVKYYKGARGAETLVYTSLLTASRAIYFGAICISTADGVFTNCFELEGNIFTSEGIFPHYNNFLKCVLNSTTGDVTGAGTSAWNSSGGSSFETIDANQDAILEFAIGQTDKALAVGFSTSDTDQNYTTIPFYVLFSTGATFRVRNLDADLSSVLSYATNDVFHIVRLNNKMYVLKNGVKVFPTTTPFTLSGALIMDTAFFSSGVIKGALLTRRAATGQLNATTVPFARLGNPNTTADEVSGRSVGVTTTNSTYRGGDNGVPVVSGVSLGLAASKPYVDGTGDAEFQLSVNAPNNPYLNFKSVARVRVRVLNKFGEQVKEFDPMTFTAAGGLLSKLTIARKYADPETEAIFALSYENAFSFSREHFLYKGITTVAPPAFQRRRDTPLECKVEEGQNRLNVSWQNPVDNNGYKYIQYRKLGETDWTQITLSDAAPTSISIVDGIFALTWYEVRLRVDYMPNVWSNIALVQTFPKIDVSYPPVDSVGGYITGGTAVIYWTPPTGASGITSYKAFKDGVEFEDSNADNAAGTSIAEGETITLTVQVVYGANLSPISTPVVLTRTVVPPDGQATGLHAESVSETNIFWVWNNNGNTGTIDFRWRMNGGSWNTDAGLSNRNEYNLNTLPSNQFFEAQVKVGATDWTDIASAYTLPPYTGDDGGGDDGGGYCFLESASVVLNSGDGLNLAELWESRDLHTGTPIRSFDNERRIRTDFIVSVSKNTVYEYLRVKFIGDDSPFEVTPRHRFFTLLKEFVAIGDMGAGDKVFAQAFDEWQVAEIESIEHMDAPDGVDVFNIETRIYKHYFVRIEGETTDKAVHNAKLDDPIITD
jgi:hypothetical protein